MKIESLELEKFNWGGASENDPGRMFCTDEIFVRKVYEEIFKVEENDIVFDVGSSVGPFTYTILHKSPKKVYCIEPTKIGYELTKTNVGGYKNVEVHNLFIGNPDNHFAVQESFQTKTFKDFIVENGIKKIDFLKTDCEEGEYAIFNEENFLWILKNVKKIVGEWHIWGEEGKQKFRNFRDLYLKHLPHQVFAVTGQNITWELWTDHFINYYTEIIIHIDNR